MNADETKTTAEPLPWWQDEQDTTRPCGRFMRPGDVCPTCGGELAYNGLFILVCKQCGAVAEGGTFS